MTRHFQFAAALLALVLSCLADPVSAQTNNTFYPTQCRQNGGASECEIGDFTLNPVTCYSTPTGTSTNISASGSTTNACRDEWIIKANALLDMVSPDPYRYRPDVTSPNCSAESWSGSVYNGDTAKSRYGSVCYVILHNPATGQIWGARSSLTNVERIATCPEGWTVYGTQPTNYVGAPHVCVNATLPKNTGECPTCQRGDTAGTPSLMVGNPINLATGNKYQKETFFSGAGLAATLHYNSIGTRQFIKAGRNWRFDYDRRIIFDGMDGAHALRGDGKMFLYRFVSGAWVGDSDIDDSLAQVVDGSGNRIGWKYTRGVDESVETYSASGVLQSITTRLGLVTTLTYSDGSTPTSIAPAPGYLIGVTNPYGRALNIAYSATGYLATVTTPDGQVIQFGYDGTGRLTTATIPGGATRTYHYESAYNPNSATRPAALTGITDENGTRFSTYQYATTTGKAISSEHAGGVNKYTISGAGPFTVTDPLNTARVTYVNWSKGEAKTALIYRPCIAAGCSGWVSETYNYNANGRMSTYVDFNGMSTLFTWDTTRNLELTRTAANGRSEQQRTTTEWNATWRLPRRVAIPLLRVTYAFHGDAGVSCAPAGASTALICSETRQATTDTNGLSGFTSALTGNARTTNYTYNLDGQLLTVDGPRSDVNDVTTYVYYAADDTSMPPKYKRGDLQSITNALNQTVTFNEYDAAGRLKRMTDANGLETTLGYSVKGELTSRTVGTTGAGFETTIYAYYPTGQLQQVTTPDGSTLTYSYDAAHRLYRVADGQGNRIDYVLDNLGNRKEQQTYDPQGALARLMKTDYNSLGWPFKDFGGTNPATMVTEYGYDNQGNLKTVKDPLNRVTTNYYDGLNRLNRIDDPVNGAGSPTYFAFNGQDKLTQVYDPKALSIYYTYSGFGDQQTLVSPDTGTTSLTYDAAGNVLTKTDARNVISTYTYDALNRVLTISNPAFGLDPAETVTYVYDSCANGIGRLCSLTDKTGTTTWSYDAKGRVTAKGQTVSGITSTLSYGYNAAGQLATLTYPSGTVVQYGYSNSRPVSVTLNPATSNTPILSNADYEPFGPVGEWTWGNSTAGSPNLHTRYFDLDGRIGKIEAGASIDARQYAIDIAHRITGIDTLVSGSVDPTRSFTYGYDNLDRLTSQTPQAGNPAPTLGFTYDKIGNRLSQTKAGATTTYNYLSPVTSHRLLSLTGATAKTYTYDAAGNRTGDGTYTWSYGGNNRPVQVAGNGTTMQVKINALGQRVMKSSTGTLSGTTRFVYDEAGKLMGEYDASGAFVAEHVWFNDAPVALLKPVSGGGAEHFYVHADHLGSPRAITRPSDNQVVWRWDNTDPFGANLANENPSGLGAFQFNLRFPGQYYDQETGLHQNYFRDYDPSTGDYIQSDPIGQNGGINTYAYVRGNPLFFSDEFGLQASPALKPPVELPRPVPTPGFAANDPFYGARLALGPICLKVVGGLGLLLTTPEPSVTAQCSDDPRRERKECQEDDCDREWREARRSCRQFIYEQMEQAAGRRKKRSVKGVTGGYTDVEECARGLVSERCGGNKKDYGNDGKPKRRNYMP